MMSSQNAAPTHPLKRILPRPIHAGGRYLRSLLETVVGNRVGRESRREATHEATRPVDLSRVATLSPGDGPPDAPIFIFSVGWRSGSTLLQRMIVQKGDTLIWGEPYDKSQVIQKLLDMWRPVGPDWPPANFLLPGDRETDLHTQWIANLYPDPQHLLTSQRRMLDALFKAPAQARGYTVWGLKEVRLGIDHARLLAKLYPDAKFLFLIRNPKDAYASYKPSRHWFRDWPNRPILTPKQFAENWSELAVELFSGATDVPSIALQYEKLDQDTRRLSDFLGFDVVGPKQLDRVKGPRRHDTTLSFAERAILDRYTRTARARIALYI